MDKCNAELRVYGDAPPGSTSAARYKPHHHFFWQCTFVYTIMQRLVPELRYAEHVLLGQGRDAAPAAGQLRSQVQ